MEKLAIIKEVLSEKRLKSCGPPRKQRGQAVVFAAKYAIFSAFLFCVYIKICLENWQKAKFFDL